MIPTPENGGQYYPVQDACDKEGDPVDKCVYTESFYFASALAVVTEQVAVYFSIPGQESFFSSSYPFSINEVLTKTDLGCNNEENE